MVMSKEAVTLVMKKIGYFVVAAFRAFTAGISHGMLLGAKGFGLITGILAFLEVWHGIENAVKRLSAKLDKKPADAKSEATEENPNNPEQPAQE